MAGLFQSFGLLLLFMLAAFGYGSKAVRWTGLKDRASLAFYLYSLGLGLGLLGHLVFVLGALRLYYPSFAWLLVVLGVLLFISEILLRRKEYSEAVLRIGSEVKVTPFLAILLLLLGSNLVYPLLASALVPPLSYDEVAYHLAIPKIFVQDHRISYISFIPYSNWPLESELLSTLGLLLGSETLTHLVSWTCFVLIIAAIFSFGKRFYGLQAGAIAAVIFTYSPVVTTLAGTALVELPLTLFTFLAIMAFLEWVNSDQRHLLVLSALFGGLAASTKLNAALTPFILGLLILTALVTVKKSNPRAAVKTFVVYGLISFAAVAPWYLKTWVFTGNPFWPFLQEIFGARDWDTVGTENLMRFIRQPNMPLTPANWAAGIWRLTSEPEKFGSYRFTLGWSYLALLPLAVPALLYSRSRDLLSKWLVFIAFVFYTAWFFQTHQTRFLMPVLPVLALLAAAGLSWLFGALGDKWSILIKVLFIGYLLFSNWLANPADRDLIRTNLPYISGRMGRDQYLTEQIPGFEAILYANNHLPKDAKIWLALFESRGYYLDREYTWANPIGQRTLPLEKFKNARSLAQELDRRGFTHVLLRTDFVDRFLDVNHGIYIKDLVLDLVGDNTRLVYRSAPYELYELLNGP
jgi:4-amino-4-deoxy-L-arabinose transferase-like glycosyltransferase